MDYDLNTEVLFSMDERCACGGARTFVLRRSFGPLLDLFLGLIHTLWSSALVTSQHSVTRTQYIRHTHHKNHVHYREALQ